MRNDGNIELKDMLGYGIEQAPDELKTRIHREIARQEKVDGVRVSLEDSSLKWIPLAVCLLGMVAGIFFSVRFYSFISGEISEGIIAFAGFLMNPIIWGTAFGGVLLFLLDAFLIRRLHAHSV